jgi:hypothetical protein
MDNKSYFWSKKPIFYWASWGVDVPFPSSISMDIVDLVEKRKTTQENAVWHGKTIDYDVLHNLIEKEHKSIYVFSFAYDDENGQLLLEIIDELHEPMQSSIELE